MIKQSTQNKKLSDIKTRIDFLNTLEAERKRNQHQLQMKINIANDLIEKYPWTAKKLTHWKIKMISIEKLLIFSAKVEWQSFYLNGVKKIQIWWRSLKNKEPNA